MRTGRRAEQVIRVERIADPVAHRFVDGRAQRAIAARHRHDRRAEQLHAADVRRLALHVDFAHVHRARQTDARAGRGTRDTVLTGARLRDHALRADALREHAPGRSRC